MGLRHLPQVRRKAGQGAPQEDGVLMAVRITGCDACGGTYVTDGLTQLLCPKCRKEAAEK